MSELLSLIPEDGIRRLVFDAVWQSSLIGLAAMILLRFFVRQPATKSWLAVLACVLCLLTPGITAGVRSTDLGMIPRATFAAVSDELPRPLVVAQAEVAVEDDAAFEPHVPESRDVASTAQPVAPGNNIDEQNSAVVASPLPSVTLSSRQFSWPGVWMVFSLSWIFITGAFLLRLLRNVIALFRICSDAVVCDDPLLVEASQKAARLLKLSKAPQVLVSDKTSCPAVISWWQPKLIVPPIDQARSEGHWVSVFAHELAHVQRGDGWARMLTEVAAVVMPWQPLIWWLRHEYHQSSEEACDDWAVFAGADPFDYASTLTEWIPRQQPTLAMGFGSWPKLVRRRVERLMEDRLPSKPAVGVVCFLATTLCAFGLVALVSLAQQGTLLSAPIGSSEEIAAEIGTDAELKADDGPKVLGDGRLSHWNLAKVLGFRPDSRSVISSSRDRTLIQWDTGSGKQQKRLTLPPMVTGNWREWPEEVQSRHAIDEIVSADGKSLIQSMANGDIRVVDISNRSFRTLEHNAQLPSKMVIGADGAILAILRFSTTECDQIDVLEMPSGRLINTITRRFDLPDDSAKPDRWVGMALSADGTRLATGSPNQVTVYDTATGQEAWNVRAKSDDSKTGRAGVLCFSPDGAKLASGGWVRNADNGEVFAEFSIAPRVATALTRSLADVVEFNPTGTALALVTRKSVHVLDIIENKQLWTSTQSMDRGLPSAKFSPDGRFLATSSGNEVLLLDAKTGERIGPSVEIDRIESIASSPMEPQLLLGMTSGEIETIELNAMTRLHTLKAHDLPVNEVLFSPNGETAASAAAHQTAIHDVASWQSTSVADPDSINKADQRDRFPRRPPRPPSGRPRPIAFSSDGSSLISFPSKYTRSRNQLQRYSTDNGEAMPTLGMSDDILVYYGLTATPDDKLLVQSPRHRGALSMWDGKTGTHVRDLERLYPRLGGRMQVCVSRQGQRIAYGVRADAVRVYDRMADSYIDLKKGHRVGELSALAFHPNGRILASTAADGKVTLWDTDNGRKLKSIKVGPRGGVISEVEWRNDGAAFVTRNGNGTASVHDTDVDRILADAEVGREAEAVAAVVNASGAKE